MQREPPCRLISQERLAGLMLPLLYRHVQPRNDAHSAPGKAAAVAVWMTPFVALAPCMAAVLIARLLAPWAKDDLNRFMAQLVGLFETSLAQAVAYRKAGAMEGVPSRPPAQPRAQSRPGGTRRPAGKPGAHAARRTRQRH